MPENESWNYCILEHLFQPTSAFIFAPNPWFPYHFRYFVQHFGSTMSDHSVNYSVTSPRPDSVKLVTDVHPSAIVLNKNAPLSPNTVLATLAAHDKVPTKSLREIISGLVATIKLRELAWEADCTAMRARINHAEDRLEAAMEGHKDEDFNFNKASVPPNFIRNNNHVASFQIPIGEGLSLPAEFIKRDEDNKTKVWGVTGRFGKGEPVYAHEIFARPVEDPSFPAEPMHPWFLRLLQGSTSSYAHLREAADQLGDWGLAADIARFRQCEDQLRELNATIHSLRAEANLTETLQDTCRIRLGAANAHGLLARLESVCHGKDCRFPIRGDFAVRPTSYRGRVRGRPL